MYCTSPRAHEASRISSHTALSDPSVGIVDHSSAGTRPLRIDACAKNSVSNDVR
jgi:hypothetical protein